jgi:hypothetical protein
MRNEGQKRAIDASAEGNNTRTHFAQNGSQPFFFLKHFTIVTDQ